MTPTAVEFATSSELAGDLKRWRNLAGAAGVAGAALCAAGFFFSPTQFYRSYLWSYLFVVGLSVGCLAWLMVQHLTGGSWGVVIRRACEAATRTLPLVALMFVPVALGINNLYPWPHAKLLAADEILRHKQPYLNTPFFLIRAAVYLGGWMLLSWRLNHWSAVEDREGGMEPHRRMVRVSAPGMIFWGFSVTFMAIDWVLSIEPRWFSTMFGMLFMAGQGLSSMALLIAVMVLLSRRAPMAEILTPRHLHDLGKLLLACVMVWAYFSFSQFLIVWAGNLPAEIPWYLERLRGGWQYVGLSLVVLHFGAPFALLLSRDLKRNFKLLAGIACALLAMRLVDLYWLVTPSFHNGGFSLSWMDIAAPVGLIGLWLAWFLTQLGRRPLLPPNDPNLKEALEHGRE